MSLRNVSSLMIVLAIATFLTEGQGLSLRDAVAAEVRSPDGKVTVDFHTDAQGQLLYSVSYQGKPVLLDSQLGLVLKEAAPLVGGFSVVNVERAEHDATWQPVYGERSEIRDHYRQMVVSLEDNQQPPRKLQLTFRAYDEGVALCYTIAKQPRLEQFVIGDELTQFRFAEDHTAWPVYAAQGVYQKTTLSEIKPNCERPLLVQFDGGPAVALAEARLVDYVRTRLQPVKDAPFTLKAHLASAVEANTAEAMAAFTTPWRVVMVADSPAELIERNYLLLNLNDPCAIEDTSWIKPGKVIREVTLSTAGGKACIDFAVDRGLQYIEYDAGWYGHEYSKESDATTITLDPKRVPPGTTLDLEEVCRYGAERGIGVIVYVNRLALERQLDEILPLYKKWGIKGLKYGFVQVGSQEATTWMHEAVRKAAKYQMVVDIHDEYRPTGYERTYPNLLTQEGIRGNEEMPPAEHNLILPFTRGLCGAGDYTICWYSNRIKTSRAHQLGCAVVFYSPLQFVYWYDRPAMYRGEPELDFFKHVPTVWDETKVLQGEVGRYITVARRSGDTWFVGTLNAEQRRELKIPLNFLPPDSKFTAEVHGDADPTGADSKKVKIDVATVDSSTILTADLAHNGGQAIRLVPVK